MELELAHRSGLDLLKDLVIQHPAVSVVILSTHDEMTYAERVLRAGARGYLMKSESSQSLLTAIRRVLAGKIFLSGNVLTAIAARLGEHKRDLLPIECLSDRELQVFELMGQGMTTSEMANRMHLSIKTVQAYVIRARENFGVDNFKQLVRKAIRWDDSSKK